MTGFKSPKSPRMYRKGPAGTGVELNTLYLVYDIGVGDDFPAMTVFVVEVESSSLVQMVNLAVVLGRWATSVGDSFFPDPS